MSTIDGIVDVPMGGIWLTDVCYFIPMSHPLESEAREKLATAIGLSVDEIFPIRWKLNVLLEGEVEMRTGDFRGRPIEP